MSDNSNNSGNSSDSSDFEKVTSEKECRYKYICNKPNCIYKHANGWDYGISCVKSCLKYNSNAYTEPCNKPYGECKFAKDCKCLFDCDEQWELYPNAAKYLDNKFNKSIPASEDIIELNDDEDNEDNEVEHNVSRPTSQTSEIASIVDKNMNKDKKPKQFIDSNNSYSNVLKNKKDEVVTPKSVATEVGTPKSVATEVVTSESVKTKVVTPKSVATEVGTPKSVATEVGTPKSVKTKVVTPKSVATEVLTPKSVATSSKTHKSIETSSKTHKSITSEPKTLEEALEKINKMKSVIESLSEDNFILEHINQELKQEIIELNSENEEIKLQHTIADNKLNEFSLNYSEFSNRFVKECFSHHLMKQMETKFSKFENILKYDKSCDISNKELLISIKNEMNKSVQVALLLDNNSDYNHFFKNGF